MEVLGKARGFRWLARWFLSQAYLLILGLYAAAMAGQNLIEERYPKGTWHWGAWYWFGILPVSLLYLFAGGLALVDDKNTVGLRTPSREELERDHRGIGAAALLFWILLWIPCFFLLYWQRADSWAVVGIGLVAAVAFGMGSKFHYRYSVIPFIGWTLAVPIAFSLAWPNGQRFLLVFVLGSLTTALQGALNFGRALRTLRRPSTLGTADHC
jgi:hypothetical protein